MGKQLIYDLVIVGAGPAGISMAAEAIQHGTLSERILVLEKTLEHNSSIRKLYPDEKLVTANYKGGSNVCHGVACISDMSKAQALDYFDSVISKYGIQISYGKAVDSISKEFGHFKIGLAATEILARVCVLAIGIFGKPNRPNFSIPVLLKDRTHYEINSKNFKNNKILVIGGGDSASEYAQYLVARNNQVFLSYRQAQFHRMNYENRSKLEDLIQQQKVSFLAESEVDNIAEFGEQVVVTFKQSIFPPMHFDHIVLALGGSSPNNFLRNNGIQVSGDRPFVGDGYESNIPGIFIIGDLVSDRKGGSIITAFNTSKSAMEKIASHYL